MSVFELWRCRECGKWAHAKRRPRAHQRGFRNVDEYVVVWCGPFDRYEARHSDPASPPALAELGSNAQQPEPIYDDPNEGIAFGGTSS
jgi:hypothetical protein